MCSSNNKCNIYLGSVVNFFTHRLKFSKTAMHELLKTNGYISSFKIAIITNISRYFLVYL